MDIEMVVKMLEGVSDMLDGNAGDKVKCGKIMLDKIIEGMKEESKDIGVVKYEWKAGTGAVDLEQTPTKKTPSAKNLPPVPAKGDYKIEVDSNRRITKIHGLPLDGKVELDGKIMTHQQAIGKQFTEGRII